MPPMRSRVKKRIPRETHTQTQTQTQTHMHACMQQHDGAQSGRGAEGPQTSDVIDCPLRPLLDWLDGAVAGEMLDNARPNRSAPARVRIPAFCTWKAIVAGCLGVSFGDFLEGFVRVVFRDLPESRSEEAQRWQSGREALIGDHREESGHDGTRLGSPLNAHGGDVGIGAPGVVEAAERRQARGLGEVGFNYSRLMLRHWELPAEATPRTTTKAGPSHRVRGAPRPHCASNADDVGRGCGKDRHLELTSDLVEDICHLATLEAAEGEVGASISGRAKDGHSTGTQNLESHIDALGLAFTEEHADLALLLQEVVAVGLAVAFLGSFAAEHVATGRGQRSQRHGEHLRNHLPGGELGDEIQKCLTESTAFLGGGRGVGVGDERRDVEPKGGDHLRVQVSLSVIVTATLTMIVRVELDLVHVQQRALHRFVSGQLHLGVSEGAWSPNHL
mmetsp:Transcript_26821/g.56837  ORF Transcript_26821/g.56837 Transcript_26821/m.56837 type:complete len:446 (-) Transcript_26821:638-1975(-)